MRNTKLLLTVAALLLAISGCAPSFPQPELNFKQPRRHHYDFAHKVLPSLVFTNKLSTLQEFEYDGQAFVERIWASMAETLDEKGLQTLDKEGLKFSKELREGINIYLVKLPHPEGITEVYFVAVLEKGQNVRYFTLEHTVAELCEGGAAAVIGEWTKDREHLNYGCGPQPEKETFVRTVVAFVRPQGQDN